MASFIVLICVKCVINGKVGSCTYTHVQYAIQTFLTFCEITFIIKGNPRAQITKLSAFIVLKMSQQIVYIRNDSSS